MRIEVICNKVKYKDLIIGDVFKDSINKCYYLLLDSKDECGYYKCVNLYNGKTTVFLPDTEVTLSDVMLIVKENK